MQNIGIFYGSTTGNTKAVAEQIENAFGSDVAATFDVSNAKAANLEQFSNIIFGCSTQGIGDLDYDFEDFINEFELANLEDKTVAIFGLGDQESYSDSFVDGIGIIYEALEGKGCKIVGAVSTDGYHHDESRAEVNGQFVGLPLDEDNQSDLSEKRIKDWVERLKKEFV